METSRLNDVMHELICRDRYLLDSTQAGMWVREIYCDLPEVEVIKEWWGEHAPPDPVAVLVMAIGDGDRLIAIPLSKAEEAKWQAAAASMWSALSEEDE
jgi:hypothetical protein